MIAFISLSASSFLLTPFSQTTISLFDSEPISQSVNHPRTLKNPSFTLIESIYLIMVSSNQTWRV